MAMHPRTLGLLLVLIFGLALAGRFVVTKFSLLPVSEEAVLKRAVAVTVTYYFKGQTKSLTIDNRAELRDLLGSLHVLQEDYYGYARFGMPRQQAVTFTFPGGRTRHCNFEGPQPYRLGSNQVDGAFYDKLCELVSRHEGEHVDVLDFRPMPIAPPKFAPLPPPRQEEGK
jgi:hypothetical protein